MDLDQLDLKIVNALQIQPRAPWNLVGNVLGASAATVMRRWRRMEQAGIAWITTTPVSSPNSACAVVELNCAHGHTTEVAQAIASDPYTGNVAVHAGGRDVLFELITPTQHDLSHYILERLGQLDGIREVRTHPVIGAYSDGSRWNLGLLKPNEERRLKVASNPNEARFQPRNTMRTMRTGALTELHRNVATALGPDARMPIKDLAQTLGISTTTAKHRLDDTLRAQPLIRCHIAPRFSGWPVRAMFFLRCPPDQIDASARLLAQTSQIRAVFITIGPHNIYIAASFRHLEDIGHLEAEIMRRLPNVSITDRSYELRLYKSIGIILNDDGHLDRRVPTH
jgi:DNA-binding Lrp family transcriptional regulator